MRQIVAFATGVPPYIYAFHPTGSLQEFHKILEGTPVAKATCWAITDAEARKRGEQIGLDTLVVHAVNVGY